jgi:hypothetical protein
MVRPTQPRIIVACSHAALRADDELAPEDQEQEKHYKDCPISFSATAARSRLPNALMELSGQRNHRLERLMTKRFARVPVVADEEEAAEVEPEPAPVLVEPPPPPPPTGLHPHLSKFFLLAEEEADLTPDASGCFSDTAAPLKADVPQEEHEEEPPKPVGLISVQLAERLWATILSLAVMEELDACWLVDDEAEPARTVVDAGREWLEARCEEDERVKTLVDCGTLQKEAKRAIRDWKRIMENSVAKLRKNDVLNRFTALTHLQRASGRVIKSMMTDHGTFATFLDADGYIMRWQRFSACPAWLCVAQRSG